MNRLAVVLAADSATTVTYFGENGPEERYFKGANKIFQLSNPHPVGVMIFDSADLLKVPWEVVIKEFRRNLGGKSFNRVAEYAAEFFAFIEANTTMFPPGVQQEAFMEAVRSAIYGLTVEPAREARKAGSDASAALHQAMLEKESELAQVSLLPCMNEADLIGILDSDLSPLVEHAHRLVQLIGGIADIDLNRLVRMAVTDVFKQPTEHMSTAGLVFAGFGDHDVFPAMASYTSCGLVGGKHVHTVGDSMSIDHATPAWLAPFAQRNMADTFSSGVSFDVYSSTMGAVDEGLAALVEKLGQAAGFDPAELPALGDLMAEARENISSAVLDRARKEHAIPMRRILGALPVDELADLAETLINLQSLKEKVTKPSTSVGGPVDVAAITKAEGLVWIKRKHFFDPAINSRYMARVN